MRPSGGEHESRQEAQEMRMRRLSLLRFAWALLTGVGMLGFGPAVMAQASGDAGANPRVTVTTNLGRFVMELDRLRAPLTVENFLEYVRAGHYEGTIFHRVVHGFVAQGGGYTADLQTKSTDRMVVNESGNGLSNLRGTVGMARTTDPHSGNAQFYLNLADNTDLDPRPTRWGYTVFGRIVEGMEVVDEIGYRPTGGAGIFSRDVPLEPIVIESMTIDGEPG
jgi:cyclophilin family peptidyl-prolyl cis-trans isomerase